MLRSIKIVKDHNLIFERNFGVSLSSQEFQTFWKTIIPELMKRKFTDKDINIEYYFQFQILLKFDSTKRLVFLFIANKSDVVQYLKEELISFSLNFLNKICVEDANKTVSQDSYINFLQSVDNTFKRLWPKITMIGYSGVGKTTIRKLLLQQSFPQEYTPTIAGEIDTIIDQDTGYFFRVWDLAGQERYQNLWANYLNGSDLVLLVTDSTLENCQKSARLINMIKEFTSESIILVIANKQDLSTALKPDEIRKIFGNLGVISFIAKDPGNRSLLIELFAKWLEIDNKALLIPQVILDQSKLGNVCDLDPKTPKNVINDFMSNPSTKWVVSSNFFEVPEFFKALEKWVYESWDILLWIFKKAENREFPNQWIISKTWIDSLTDNPFHSNEFELVWFQLLKSPFVTKSDSNFKINKFGQEFAQILSKNMYAKFGIRIRN